MPYPNLASPPTSVIILVADGARPDTLRSALDDGHLPALAQLRDEGEFATVTTVFPSVTGPAYTPFIMGKHPGDIGLPGLRWYDRTHAVCSWPSYARSYVGFEMQYVDTDLDPDSPTLFELASPSLGALSVIERGLSKETRVAQGLPFITRTALTHFRGNVAGWLDIDRDIGHKVAEAIHDIRPRFTYAAFTGPDKTSHAEGHTAPIVLEALKIVDDVAAQIRYNAERGGYWNSTHLWIVSDHGHSPVTTHEDLAGLLASSGFHVLAHPMILTPNPEIAVMVSGNAMAHLYVNLDHTTRPFWPALQDQWNAIATMLLERASVDLLILPLTPQSCEIRTKDRGNARVEWTSSPPRQHTESRAFPEWPLTQYTYRPLTGDPLAIGSQTNLDAHAAYDATRSSDYPDALVQLAHLCSSSRCGDMILSASRHWDFRAKHEPIPHVSSHGALHREHMLAPIILNHPPARTPRRTIDVMPSAAHLLGLSLTLPEAISFL